MLLIDVGPEAVESEEELSVLAKEANRATTRMIKRLDETIAHVDRVLGS